VLCPSRARGSLARPSAAAARRRSLAHPSSPPPPPGFANPTPQSIYTDGDGKAQRQSFASLCVALVTLTIYCGWMHLMIGLLLASFFSRWALASLLLLLSTLLLPAKPVLWTAFCASPVFKTWRAYFSYSYLAVSCRGVSPGVASLAHAPTPHAPTPLTPQHPRHPPPPPRHPPKKQEEILSSRDEKDPSKPKSYIFVEFPHGAIPLSELISGTVCQVRERFFSRK
jgi:hypothetical protein